MIAMPNMLLYDQSKSEQEQIRDWDSTAEGFDQDVWIQSAVTLQELFRQLSEVHEISVCCADFEAGGEQAVQAVRDKDHTALIVAIAGKQYIRPALSTGILRRTISCLQRMGK